jgi:hypothetical protein
MAWLAALTALAVTEAGNFKIAEEIVGVASQRVDRVVKVCGLGVRE